MKHRSGIARGRARRYPRARGFTLVELLVAIMVMTVGILGLASTAGVVTRLMSGAARQTVAAVVVQSRFEQMRNHTCASLTGGSATTRRVRERWGVSFPSSTLALVVDTARFATMSGRPAATRIYRSYLPCR
ncbi:MAG TPA: prepilin-type N-terminal cleavage/methylation domain-containing protein [Gemmatimonadaceae bacterium]